MNAVEQIILCKLMLFSYIYHHQKVRAAEGMLENALTRAVEVWREKGEDDARILQRFLGMTDSSLFWALDKNLSDPVVKEYSYRIVNRLLPREVYGISASDASHAEGVLLSSFTTALQDRERKEKLVLRMEEITGEELRHLRPELAGGTWKEALLRAGVWVDVPKPPEIEGIEELIAGGKAVRPVPLKDVLPIREWTEAYTHYRYHVRIFAFSEYHDAAASAARKALEEVTKISSSAFYDGIRRRRA